MTIFPLNGNGSPLPANWLMPDLNDLFAVSSNRFWLATKVLVLGKPIRTTPQALCRVDTQNGITIKWFLCLIYGQAIFSSVTSTGRAKCNGKYLHGWPTTKGTTANEWKSKLVDTLFMYGKMWLNLCISTYFTHETKERYQSLLKGKNVVISLELYSEINSIFKPSNFIYTIWGISFTSYPYVDFF